jgi:hypothetical protein
MMVKLTKTENTIAYQSCNKVRNWIQWLIFIFCLCMFGPFLASFSHQFSHTIQYYLVIICPLVMVPYPHRWWFPWPLNSPISRARTTHSTRYFFQWVQKWQSLSMPKTDQVFFFYFLVWFIKKTSLTPSLSLSLSLSFFFLSNSA